MNLKARLTALRDCIQDDVGKRGLRTDAEDNLVANTAYDFAQACQSFRNVQRANIAIVTGFVIPSVDPPRAETDGPLGAFFLARCLNAMGMKVTLVTDKYGDFALRSAVMAHSLHQQIHVLELPIEVEEDYVGMFRKEVGPLTHLIALERVGPSHTPQSIMSQLEGGTITKDRFLREVPAEHHDRCHTMKGTDITELTSPTHLLFEADAPRLAEVTIGIGDGGNEIGMGNLSWDTIRKNIPGGKKVACRIATDYLIVAGISNWGGYALAAGISLVRNAPLDASFFDVQAERQLLERMIQAGPLVDGVTGQATLSVDGLEFTDYIKPLEKIGEILFAPVTE